MEPKGRLLRILIQILNFLLLFSLLVFKASVKADDELVLRHETRKNISTLEKTLNFSLVYAVQWGFYLYSQEDTIEKHGSFDNMNKNIFKTRFDRDYLDYNIIKHTFAGQGYYLFYRSRGYGLIQSFSWTFFSSLAFEYAIETYTEPASVQDIYLTPVLGTVAGVGFEALSLYFHSWNSVPGKILGTLFNPFTLLPFSSYEWRLTPYAGKGKLGASLQVEF